MALTMSLMMLVSCNKDKENSKEAVFTANIEQHISQQNRTAINPENGQVKWLAGDKILVANGEGETAQFTLQSGAGTTEGTFRTTGEFEMDAPFTAAYPQTATLTGTTSTFTLPATQTLTETGTFANGANPMAAYASDGNLYFRNLCGGLDVRLLGDNVHVSGIRITGAESEKLNGTFAVDCSANEPAIMANQGTNGTNIVTLNCDAVLDAETATEFFIVLPVGALAQGFTMEVLDGTEVICTKPLETNLAQIVRNEVKRFNPLLIGETPTPIELPDVVTNQVTDITTTAATVGGEIVSDGGSAITECGVCYKTGNEDWTCVALTATNNAFSTALEGLAPNTTYTVRAYATNEGGTGYGEEVSFTTLNDGGGDTHEYVDLGLPSGLLWATCNVGAETPEGYGYYFAWGETTPKTTYNWSTYLHCIGSYNNMTKYCQNPGYGYLGFEDDLTVLLPEDDAATANWGSGWRMPTKEEWEELYNNTTVTWTTQNGVNGSLFTASNSNSLFLPAAGHHRPSGLDYVGRYGIYWSSSLYTSYPYYAWYFDHRSGDCHMSGYYRSNGQSVRAVREN